ncbi:MAG TPA: sugar O-acetyltransferase [Casimicrobiaceae bacterium]|jgi:maltose O-acetyltransferase
MRSVHRSAGLDAVAGSARVTRVSTQEAQRMLGGLPYDPRDPVLVRARRRARTITHDYNHAAPGDGALRARLLKRLLGRCGKGVVVVPPFHCDYGTYIELADDVFVNMQCVVLDCARVTVGARTLLGPGVMLLAATHPVSALERRSGLESAAPIHLGEDVWLGGGVIVCPGVTIGARAVVGAGSVVTRDLPSDVVAAGNPCRVLRAIPSAAR